jgi:hypothetical protein
VGEDEVPGFVEGVEVGGGVVAVEVVHEEEGVEEFGLGPPDLVAVVGLIEGGAFVVEAAAGAVVAELEGVIDEGAGDGVGVGVVGAAEEGGGFDEEECGFDVMAERIVVGQWPPVGGEELVEAAGGDGHAVADEGEQFLDALADEGIGPGAIELDEGFEEVEVGVEGFVAVEGADGVVGVGWVAGLGGGGEAVAVAVEGLPVAAVFGIVADGIEPAECGLGELERLGVAERLVSGCEGVDGEALAVGVFVGAEGWIEGAGWGEFPVESAAVAVPHDIVEAADAVAEVGFEFVGQIGAMEDDLGCDPGEA